MFRGAGQLSSSSVEGKFSNFAMQEGCALYVQGKTRYVIEPDSKVVLHEVE